jgi:hypothetical protein
VGGEVTLVEEPCSAELHDDRRDSVEDATTADAGSVARAEEAGSTSSRASRR